MSERRPYRYWEDPAWVADSDPKVVAKLIRNQRDLLDECQRAFVRVRDYSSDPHLVNLADVTLAKLRGEK